MSRQTFINLPVEDLEASTAFFSALGFEFNTTFSDENCACLVISDETFAMLLVQSFYQRFTRKQLVDARTHSEVVICLSAESRDEVDTLVHTAIAAGGKPAGDPIEDGPMYGWSFEDVDGHVWELVHMELPE